MPRSSPSPYVSLADRAYASVLERLKRGKLEFGHAVSRRATARELKMSLPPVAEAFQKLEHEGLLESRPRVGTRVRVPSVEDIKGHYMVREALECQAARLFATGASEPDRELLKQRGAELDRMLSGPDVNRIEYLNLHEQFHGQVPRATCASAFVESFRKTQIPIWTWISCSVFWADFRTNSEPRWKTQSHWELADALSSRGVVEAEAAMRAHVQAGLDLILKHLEARIERPTFNRFR